MKANCHELSKGFSHNFQETTYFTPTYCDHCGGLVRKSHISFLISAYNRGRTYSPVYAQQLNCTMLSPPNFSLAISAVGNISFLCCNLSYRLVSLPANVARTLAADLRQVKNAPRRPYLLGIAWLSCSFSFPF